MKWLPLSMAALGLCRVTFGDTVNLSPAADTTISENNSANTDVVPGHMVVGHLNFVNAMSRGLLRFDLSQIPSGATVTSVTLRVTVTRSASAGDIHALHRVTSPWMEAATWINTGFDEWFNGGGDYQSTPDATLNISGQGDYSFASTPAMVSSVQSWLDDIDSNHGWILRSQSESTGQNGRRFTTREESASLSPPLLTVQYTTPPAAPTITLNRPRVADGKLKFDFTAEGGFTYIAQYKGALQPGNWTDFAWIPDPGTITPVTVEDPLTTTNRFYRVVVATWP